jgi:hypothetical protein
VFFQASKHRIDVTFVDVLAALYCQFFAKLFVVSTAESGHRRSVNAAEFAFWVVVVKDVCGRIFFVVSLAVSAPHNVDAIVFTIEQTVNIAQIYVSPVTYGSQPILHAAYGSDSA